MTGVTEQVEGNALLFSDLLEFWRTGFHEFIFDELGQEKPGSGRRTVA